MKFNAKRLIPLYPGFFYYPPKLTTVFPFEYQFGSILVSYILIALCIASLIRWYKTRSLLWLLAGILLFLVGFFILPMVESILLVQPIL